MEISPFQQYAPAHSTKAIARIKFIYSPAVIGTLLPKFAISPQIKQSLLGRAKFLRFKISAFDKHIRTAKFGIRLHLQPIPKMHALKSSFYINFIVIDTLPQMYLIGKKKNTYLKQGECK
jgi:hypothetical protein